MNKLGLCLLIVLGLVACKKSKTTDVIVKGLDVDSVGNSINSDKQVIAENVRFDTIYRDTIIFQQYMDYGDFPRVHTTKHGIDISPVYDTDNKSLTRGDIALLEWRFDSIAIPEAPSDKWVDRIAVSLTKIKEGKLALYRKKYPQAITYSYDKSISETDAKEYLDEIYELVQYYLANSTDPLVVSTVESQSDSLQIQYTIELQDRMEKNQNESYFVVGLSNYFEHHNSIFRWLYLKRYTGKGYLELYEYDLPKDKLKAFK